MRMIRREIVYERLCELNVTWDEFKHDVGVDRRTLERILSGQTQRPHPHTISKISDYLDLLPEQFLKRKIGVSAEHQHASPFVVGTPINDPACFFGRQDIIKRLLRLWQTVPMQNAAIIGRSAMGKTSLFQYLLALSNISQPDIPDKHSHNQSALFPISINYLSLANPLLQTPEAIYNKLLPSFSHKDRNSLTETSFYEETTRETLKERTVIILDDIDSAFSSNNLIINSFWEGLRHLASFHTESLSFLLGCKRSPFEYADAFGLSSPFFNIFGYATTIGKLTLEDANNLISSSPIPFEESDSEWIIRNSRLYPRLLQILCWERLASLEDNGADESWRASARERIVLLPEFNQ